ncbi:MAG: AI-2E family transporter, partial [Coriobacteriia bacterium]|nr:AI-2E family transporter [Coriobacteriia bacterium]
METPKNTNRATRAAIIAWGTIGWLVLAAGAFWLLGAIAPALVPFMMGGVIILVLRAPVNLLEARGMPRAWAVAACYVLMISGIALLSSFVIPAIVSQLQQFTHDFPSYYRLAELWWNGLQGQVETVVLPLWVRSGVSDAVATISSNLTSWASTAAGGVLSAGQSAATLLIDFVLAFVIGFWALKDLPKVRLELMGLIGEHRRGEAEMVLETVLRVLGGYVRGQLM